MNVSVIIPTFGRAKSLAIAIRSALIQDDAVLEVVVVDDNRRAEDSMAVRRALEDIGDKRVIYCRNDGAPGGAAARNFGLRLVRAPYVAFLDDDDYWLPGKITTQLAMMQPGIVGVDCGHIERDDGWNLLLKIKGESRRITQAHLLGGYCPTSTSFLLLRHETATAAGLFDSELASFQDYDFRIRCAAFGDFISMPNPGCVYVQHSGYRLSVAVETRLRGLEQFLSKWGDRIGDAAAFRRHWKSLTYIVNARRALVSDRARAFRFAVQALRVDPARRHPWQSLAFALVGFRVASLLVRMRNSSRSLSAAERIALTNFERLLAESIAEAPRQISGPVVRY